MPYSSSIWMAAGLLWILDAANNIALEPYRAAALTLTDLFGENFDFVDTTEVSYGLPSRSYKSFIDASEEAAISRLYGGIHYMMAITEGVAQGQNVGDFIVKNIQTKKISLAVKTDF